MFDVQNILVLKKLALNDILMNFWLIASEKELINQNRRFC